MNEISIDSTNTVELDVKKYSFSLLDQVSGIAKTVAINETTSLIYGCRLVLLPRSNMR